MRFGLFGSAQAKRGGPDDDSGAGFREFVERNVEAEALGYVSTFLVEHHCTGFGQVSATLNLLTWIGARTTTLRLGTAVLVLPWHHPVLLAEQVATLDLLSGGRVDFGIGKGYRDNEFTGFCVPMEEAEARCKDVVVESPTAQKPHPPIWMGAGSPASVKEDDKESAVKHAWTHTRFNRRALLRQGALASLGIGLLPLPGTAQPSPHAKVEVRRYGPLGHTGIRMSDISFGSSRLHAGEEALVLHAYDRGINYFDTAESYTGGEAEATLGNALHDKRDKVYIASKVNAGASARQEALMAALEGSLRRLRTDYVDVYFNHAVNDVRRLQNPEWYEFTERARRQGKIRATGMSGHAGHLIECLDYALEAGRVDVILVAYNFGQDPAFYQRFTGAFDFIARQPDLPRVLRQAKAKGVGVVAMKTLMGARLNDMRPFETGGATFAQAAFRWVLANADVDGLIISMKSRERINEYLGASGWRSAAHGDLPLLQRYARLHGTSYCRHGCNDCAGTCPYGVPIADVLRTRMYAQDYGDMQLARSEYAQLGAGASPCLTCAEPPCAHACPHGLPIDTLLAPLHPMLVQPA